MAKPSKPRNLTELRASVAAVRLKGPATSQTDRARKLLLVYLDAADSHAVPFAELVKSLRSGLPALRIAGAELARQASDPAGPFAGIDCAAGCAFCCILSGTDGGTITAAEAEQLHAALAPQRGKNTGAAWHPQACAALDPATRQCRAYDARPLICRSYISTDVTACERIAEGTPAAGAGVVGAQGLALAVHALIRAALEGVSQVPTYALARITAGAMAGEDAATTLRAARQPPRALDDERRRFGA